MNFSENNITNNAKDENQRNVKHRERQKLLE